ncbi:Uncharacterised protein [Vibrio cholerae]|nr:Uncharacterised protein [Vibrio cholerae]
MIDRQSIRLCPYLEFATRNPIGITPHRCA